MNKKGRIFIILEYKYLDLDRRRKWLKNFFSFL